MISFPCTFLLNLVSDMLVHMYVYLILVCVFTRVREGGVEGKYD